MLGVRLTHPCALVGHDDVSYVINSLLWVKVASAVHPDHYFIVSKDV